MVTDKQQQKIDKLLLIYGNNINSYIEQNDYKFSQEYFIECVVASDPDKQGKSVKWVLNNVLNGNILWEDVESGDESKVYDTLNRFYSIRQQFKDTKLKDINQFKRLGDIAEQLRCFEVIQSNKELKKDKKEQIYRDTIFLYNQNGYLVVVPKTEESSCFWGLNTEWCTAATRSRNMFNYYNKYEPLYICITPDGKKYQFHKNSEPMDQNDNPVNNITDPVLRELTIITGRISSIKEINYHSERECLEACKQNGCAIQYIPRDISNYEQCCLESVKQDGNSIQYIPRDISNYEQCCLEAVGQYGWTIKCITRNISNYAECCLEAVKQNGLVIQDISHDIDNYAECCLEAVKQDGNSIQDIPRDKLSLEQYIECCLEACKKNGYSIKHIPRDIDNYEKCCLEAVKKNGWAIQYIPRDISNYAECCLEAVKQYGWTIKCITRDISNYAECCLEAVKQNGYVIQDIPHNISNYAECLKISEKFKEEISQEIKKEEKVIVPDWMENDVLKNKDYFNELVIPQVEKKVELLI